MIYLVDTNVLSEWRKLEPNAGVVTWFKATRPDKLYLSVITVGEIRRGIVKLQQRGEHRKATEIESWLGSTMVKFAERLVPITADVAEEWGACCGAHAPVPTADGLIAATARVHGWTVVTRNVKDFEPTGVRLLNPFTE